MIMRPESLLEAGVDVCRFNYSHGEPEDKTDLYHRLRSIEDELGRPTCILADLPGPKLRLGNFPEVDLLEEGAEILLHCGAHLEATNGTEFPLSTAVFRRTEARDPILVNDGLIRLTVLTTPVKRTVRFAVGWRTAPHQQQKGRERTGTWSICPPLAQGQGGPEHALENGADYIAVSYVRTADDLIPPKKRSLKPPCTYRSAKIEHPVALENLDSILDVADAVMVARGDLGVEIPLENVPVVQQRIIDKALQRGMPVIVATQMLDSMTSSPSDALRSAMCPPPFATAQPA